MTHLLRRAVLTGALLLAATAAHAQRVAAPARAGLPQHYLLSDNAGTWTHSSAAMGELSLTLNPDGTFRFAQAKSGQTKRLAGEYAFMDDRRSKSGTDLLLFSGPRASGKTPSVRWSYSKAGKDAIILRDRYFFRAKR
jgi:hypothetical protein